MSTSYFVLVVVSRPAVIAKGRQAATAALQLGARDVTNDVIARPIYGNKDAQEAFLQQEREREVARPPELSKQRPLVWSWPSENIGLFRPDQLHIFFGGGFNIDISLLF